MSHAINKDNDCFDTTPDFLSDHGERKYLFAASHEYLINNIVFYIHYKMMWMFICKYSKLWSQLPNELGIKVLKYLKYYSLKNTI